MEIEFDADKDEVNRFKHGLSLTFGERIFDDAAHEVITTFRVVDEERRFKIVGRVNGKLFTAIFVPRHSNPDDFGKTE